MADYLKPGTRKHFRREAGSDSRLAQMNHWAEMLRWEALLCDDPAMGPALDPVSLGARIDNMSLLYSNCDMSVSRHTCGPPVSDMMDRTRTAALLLTLTLRRRQRLHACLVAPSEAIRLPGDGLSVKFSKTGSGN